MKILTLISIFAIAIISLACANTNKVCANTSKCEEKPTELHGNVVESTSVIESAIASYPITKDKINDKKAVNTSSDGFNISVKNVLVGTAFVTGVIMMWPAIGSWLELHDNKHWYTFMYTPVLIVGVPLFIVGAGLAAPGLSYIQ